jgi:hypothetical protein
MLDSGLGMVLSASVTMNSHTAATAQMEFSHSGVSILGTVPDVTFGGVTVTQAFLNIQLASANSGMQSSATIGGSVSFHGFTATVDVELAKSSAGEGVQWVIFGELDIATGDMKLSRLNPSLNVPFLDDIAFSKIAFLAASSENPGLTLNTPFPIKKGIQICAVIDQFPILSELFQSKQIGLILSASFSGSGFDIGIELPATTQVSRIRIRKI